MFVVTAVILVVGALVFSFMAAGEVQEWARNNRNLPQILQEPLLPSSNDSTDGDKSSVEEKQKILV